MRFVDLVNSARDPLTDQFPRKMLAGQRGGGFVHSAWDPLIDTPRESSMSKKKKAENADMQEISPIRTGTKSMRMENFLKISLSSLYCGGLK